MDITWHGGSCFTIKGKKGTVVTNPYSKHIKNEKLKADVVLVTDMGYDKLLAVGGEPRIFDIPGEYEVSEIPVIGVQVPNKKTIFQFRVDDINFCQLGTLDQPISADLIEKIGDVDVLLVPVGGDGTLDAKKAHDVIEEIEPRIVIPMEYDDLTAFAKISSIPASDPKDSFSAPNRAALPQDKTEYVVLNAK